MLYRRGIDVERGFDRYECIIFTSQLSASQSFSVAQAAVAVLERSFSSAFVSFSVSSMYTCTICKYIDFSLVVTYINYLSECYAMHMQQSQAENDIAHFEIYICTYTHKPSNQVIKKPVLANN